jgi:class 3 adenylate cyclase/tetratricopeptide (TPR) repeat protein
VTVLFADVKGSMDLAGQVDPEEWHRILNRFFEILTDGVHRFEGTVNQYTGDGIMALFGAPIAHEDHAQRACYAALHLSDELRRYANELRLERGLSFSTRMGLNSGEVVVGKIGDDLRMDYTAQGQTVGLAARMEQIAAPDRVYLSEQTAHLVEGFFDLRDLGATRVQGLTDAIHVYELEGIGALRTRLDRSRARGFSKFVGRSNEVASLEAALERAIEGHGQVVGVVGEAGVGKSRLCYELAELCRARGITVRPTSGVSHGKAIPLLPILELLRQGFGITSRDSDLEARQKIAGGIVLLDEDLRDELPLLFDFLSVPDPERPANVLGAEARQRRILELLKRISIARSRRAPGVLIFEDLHWIDPATQLFVEALADATEGARTLMLVNFRPEYRAEWMHRSYYQQLALRPLDQDGIDEILGEWLGSDPSLQGISERIGRRTGGNPFFIEEVVQGLIESGQLVGERGHYRLVGNLEQLTIPTTVQSVLAARIDRLAERDKQVLQTAAVIGKEFPESLLEKVAEMPKAELAEAFRSLVQGEFLYEQALYPEVEYAFKHPLTQEVAYDSQLRERRERIHAAVAKALEELHAEAFGEKAALLAHHWEEARATLEAARWHQRATEWIGMNDPTQTLHHAQRVRDLLANAPDSTETLELRVAALGSIVVHGTRLGLEEGELEAIMEEGNSLLSRGGDHLVRASFLASIGMAFILEGRLKDAVEVAEEAISRADESGDAQSRASSRGLLAYPLMLADSADRGLAMINETFDTFGGKSAFEHHLRFQGLLSIRAVGLLLSGHLDEAGPTLDRTIELTAERGDRTMHAVTHGYYAALERWRGAPQSALAHARQSVEEAEQVGSPTGLRQAYYQLGHARYCNGQLEEARAVLERGLATGRGRYFATALLSSLAETSAGLGDHDRASEAAMEAIAVAEATGQSEIPAQIALARVLRCADGIASEPAIRSALDRALELIEESGARVYRPGVHEERAELAQLLGDDATRERELREAHRLYTEMGATGHAERVAGVLTTHPE